MQVRHLTSVLSSYQTTAESENEELTLKQTQIKCTACREFFIPRYLTYSLPALQSLGQEQGEQGEQQKQKERTPP